jgi:hypothetical protein
MERDATKVSSDCGMPGCRNSQPGSCQWPGTTVPNPDVRPGARREVGMRFFDDRAHTLVQIIADLIGLLFFFAILTFLLDAIVPH